MISHYSHPTASPLTDCIAKFSCTFFFLLLKAFLHHPIPSTISLLSLCAYLSLPFVFLLIKRKKKKTYMLDCQKIRKLGSFPKEEKISTWTKISQRTNFCYCQEIHLLKKRKRFWGKCKLSLMSQPIDSNLIWGPKQNSLSKLHWPIFSEDTSDHLSPKNHLPLGLKLKNMTFKFEFLNYDWWI